MVTRKIYGTARIATTINKILQLALSNKQEGIIQKRILTHWADFKIDKTVKETKMNIKNVQFLFSQTQTSYCFLSD